jgi:hypothetical protein
MDRNSLPADVLEALRRGNKIEAIKRLREVAKMGLAEAKGVVDALEGHATAEKPGATPRVPHAAPHVQRRPRVDDLSPGEAPRSSLGPAVFVIVLAALAFAVWLFLKK